MSAGAREKPSEPPSDPESTSWPAFPLASRIDRAPYAAPVSLIADSTKLWSAECWSSLAVRSSDRSSRSWGSGPFTHSSCRSDQR